MMDIAAIAKAIFKRTAAPRIRPIAAGLAIGCSASQGSPLMKHGEFFKIFSLLITQEWKILLRHLDKLTL
ncbi:MAG: hypothetical protein WA842_03680 [Croceibacterium sp.]